MESNTKKYDNTNRWTLFRNEEKKSDTWPEFSGELNINGDLYWLDGWVREGQDKKFFSGTVKLKKAGGSCSKSKAAIDEDVPF